MRPQVVDYIKHHEEEIDANQFDWLFAAAPTAGVERYELMRVFMEAGIEPLRYMNIIPIKAFYQYPYPLTIPSNIERIEMSAFEEAQFTEITIPEGVESLSNAIFKNCQNLRKITLPKSLTKIQSWIFFHCYNIEEVIYNGTIEEFLSIDGMRRDAFVSSVTSDQYSFKIKCFDGELSIQELPMT